MGGGAVVFDLDVLKRTAHIITEISYGAGDRCQSDLQEAEQLLEESQEEENRSQLMLDAAKLIEAEKLAVRLKYDAELAEAFAEETAAIASANPILAAEAGARIIMLTPKVAQAAQEHEEAEQHRERMETRHEMATKCVELAQLRIEKMRFQYGQIMTNLKRTVQEGADRLKAAWETLQEYIDKLQPEARQIAADWFNWKPKERQPVTPKEVHDRLNVNETVVDTILEYLYDTDLGFRATVDGMRSELYVGGSEDDVALKAKKNMVGRLCEEIVMQTFLPMGGRITTQERYTLPDGSYTKVDMILYELKEPLILGRGAGAQAGGSLAIEVKSGGKQYILQQLEHMLRQAQGHQDHAISCVVCTRDIKDLSPEYEEKIRTALREAGSPIYGMLPRKESLDIRCIRFVKAGVKK